MTLPIFVDTSALYAALDADDDNHVEAAASLTALLEGSGRGELDGVTSGSVVVESAALVQRRLGMDATRVLLDDVLPLLDIVWVDEALHAEAVTAFLAAGRRTVSLVDWTSFVVMRRRVIDHALAFDADFVDQGFTPFRP